MPFLWDSVAAQGQILGDATHGSVARVTNGFNFSYPGYNETLTGRGDPRINTNAYPPNPNVTVFEWLNRQPGLGGKVAAFGTWDAFPGSSTAIAPASTSGPAGKNPSPPPGTPPRGC